MEPVSEWESSTYFLGPLLLLLSCASDNLGDAAGGSPVVDSLLRLAAVLPCCMLSRLLAGFTLEAFRSLSPKPKHFWRLAHLQFAGLLGLLPLLVTFPKSLLFHPEAVR